ncbi:hypothetical protein HanXRQr2_Chr09g0408571 [Helianthus annuus]|uniref:Uncharacterized protein n=1 Tax=Helianthus annuus TaxID=4232 RepID=A0A9K3IA34_HELAN|nr:hypothetical protein HanXRQr2_Chr09g0408571 [Helianthus annuus]KAJ0894938.1 hypothetical protein HanPSC8_Chr09g0394551 [Helianthus annuus]
MKLTQTEYDVFEICQIGRLVKRILTATLYRLFTDITSDSAKPMNSFNVLKQFKKEN